MKITKMRYISITLSIIAASCSIATLIVVWNGSNEYLGFDSSAFYGCLITVLSILVVVLMGWQIINYLSFEDKIRKEIENAISIADKRMDDKIALYDNKIGSILMHTKANYIFNDNPKATIYYYVIAIECACKAGINKGNILSDLTTILSFIEMGGGNIVFSDDELSAIEKRLLKCDIDNQFIDRIKKLREKKDSN